MPVNLPENIQKEKNKLKSDSAILTLLEIALTGELSIYFVNRKTSYTYEENEYLSLNFNIGDLKQDESTGLPTRTISVVNPELVTDLHTYFEDYGGLIGKVATVTTVFSEFPEEDMSGVAQEYEVVASAISEKGFSFTLGSSNMLTTRFPRCEYSSSHCRYVQLFKGVLCGYDGEETSCDGTLLRCYELGNAARFGGQPGLRSDGTRYV